MADINNEIKNRAGKAKPKMRKVEPEAFGPIAEMSEGKPRKHFPEFHINLKHLPEAKKWEIGEKYQVVLNLQMSSIDQRNEKDGRGEGHVGFDIIGIGVGK